MPLVQKRNKTNDICIISDISSHPQQHIVNLRPLLVQFGSFHVFLLCLSVAVAESLVTKESMRSGWLTPMGSGAAPRICGTEFFFPAACGACSHHYTHHLTSICILVHFSFWCWDGGMQVSMQQHCMKYILKP